VNHTSDEHAWFKEACTSKNSPYRDYYIWSPPGENGGLPNNWEAAFSGSVWEYHEPTGEYYLHMFSKKQPDLNWENPKVRAEVYDLMRFWLDKGVDGFRMDVITLISKPFGADGRLPDAPVVRDGFLQPGFQLVANGPRLFEFLREMNREVLSCYDGPITVGEAPGATTFEGSALTNAETGVLDMIFHFEHMEADYAKGIDGGKWVPRPLDLVELKDIMTRWQVELHGCGWNSLYLSNHDQPRLVSRFGDDGRYRVESAKMLATFLHGLQGTPYIYQGEEIGMTNMPFASIDDCRDNARTPMQWTAAAHAGFTAGKPWIGTNPNFTEINVEAALADTDSVFHYYKRLIALRKTARVLVDGDYRLLLRSHPEIYAYLRILGSERWLIVCNFAGGSPEFRLPESERFTASRLILANYPVPPGDDAGRFTLRPYETRIYQLS